MKRQSVPVFVGVVFLPPLSAQADLSIIILSETYHVSGYVERGDFAPYPEEPDYIVPGDYQSYDLTTSSPPASGEVSIWADTWDGKLTATSLANRYESGGDAWFYVEAVSTRIGLGGGWLPYGIGKDAYASLDVDFMFTGSADQLYLDVGGNILYSAGTRILARDDGQSWLLYDGSYGEGVAVWWDAADPIPIDVGQVYTLSIDVHPWAAGEGGGYRTVTFHNVSDVTVAPVPIPSVALLDRTIDIVSGLDPGVLTNRNTGDTLVNKLEATSSLIEAALYQDALMKLQHDILPKTDGGALTGQPDDNDWITTAEAQQNVYPLVLQAISFLEQLI